MLSLALPDASRSSQTCSSSRLCVKNLPKYVGEDKLREFFSQKGEVTDAKIMRTRDGKSRQFAFVGFRSEQEAEEALSFFNNSYMDTFKIKCEVARQVNDPNIPRPWSKHSLKKADLLVAKDREKGTKFKTSNFKNTDDATAVEIASTKEENNDPQLQEFLSIMQSRSKSKLWSNDTLGGSLVGPANESDRKDPSLSEENKIRIVNSKTDNTSNGSKSNKQLAAGSVYDSIKSLTKSSKKSIRDDDMSDMDYFRSKVKKKWSDVESDGDDSHNLSNEDIQMVTCMDDGVKLEKSAINGREQNGDLVKSSIIGDDSEQAVDSVRLFVRNLPYTTCENELWNLFGRFGEVDDIHLVVDKDTKRSKGIGYVLYKLHESAVSALAELDNSIFQGRLLHVMPAKRQPSNSSLNLGSGQNAKSFKQKRLEQKKESEVTGNTKSWNSLFMRPDTVVENIARKYGVSKSDLLDQDTDDLAVRIALGETQVIAETKKALSNAGVNVAALEKYVSKQTEDSGRSNEVILVKNLPFHSCEGDLVAMFGRYGCLDKVILPPTKALALVVFLEPAEARAAFKGLAYKRYKDVPLYLEWPPSDILSRNPCPEPHGQKSTVEGQEIKTAVDRTLDGVPDDDLDLDRTESRSLFVKNLNFKTSDDSLKMHFSDNIKKGQIRSVKIKKHAKNGKIVSMGYGFVEFDSLETASDVCRDLQGTIFDGHALILQLCHEKKNDSSKKKIDKGMSSSKLIVRNVAFEATQKDIRQLFSPFGQIKSVRLPMKFGSHRGFAFVEYVTKREAQNALQALSNTHLYGRHLVLEPAKEGESLEELRARTASQFLGATDGIEKLSKKRKLMLVADESKHKFERIIE